MTDPAYLHRSIFLDVSGDELVEYIAEGFLDKGAENLALSLAKIMVEIYMTVDNELLGDAKLESLDKILAEYANFVKKSALDLIARKDA
ncbi:MAG TPA: hypothetical protein PL000_07210 [Anaerolineales bacterium]|nr:hypothetical protein [Anaerolineales bacterium]